ncbi:hypothetical protein [Pedobacter zeae]|uniref:Uncharacterized protein n=1 Tax=Pedobacter zeae TaxID=1737356 RepID=A0A7W6KAS8_9SPHI|nr:hypothetical protein [Pedobacter zeae]MBB4108341.1 hypothetical protein [Pedobacter zeae]GGG93429.1 hypothetical protein GCM10007422_03320 [Pedobacter zeae]
MMKNKLTSIRQNRIDAIMGLLSGKAKPSDMPAKLILKQPTDGNRTYYINGKLVDKKTFDEECGKLPWYEGNFKSIGRPDDDAEYYYGEVPFTIYTDGTALKC